MEEYDEDINFQSDVEKWSALMVAAMYNRTKIACALLWNGADPNLTNKWQNTAFILASQRADTLMMSILLIEGCDYNFMNVS